MAITRVGVRVAGCLLLLVGLQAARAATPTVEDLLKLQPKMDVLISTPNASEYAACKVEVLKDDKGGSGYLLRDPRGLPLRRFYDSNGDRYIDIWSYYLDGQEVYREIDTNFNRKADQYRWYGQAGMKVGIDSKEIGKIDHWEQISPEEVSQEVLQAVITRDFDRLKALMVNENDLHVLELPADELNRIKEKMARAPQKFTTTAAGLINLGKKTQWIHLETAAPQCIPADSFGGNKDLIRYKSGTILYANDGKHDFLQTGEMILVGKAWKIVDAPAPGYAADTDDRNPMKGGSDIVVDEKSKPLLDKLREVDAEAPKMMGDAATIVRYNLARATVLDKLAEISKGEQRESWLKQMADCYSAAAQNSQANDRSSYQRLIVLRDRMAKEGDLRMAGYVEYRAMSAEYSVKLMTDKETAKVQEQWREKLKKFYDTYPMAEDAPDALLQLGMVSEFVGKETEARNWYDTLARQYPKNALAKKAQGAVRRLDAEGKPMELAGSTLGDTKPFEIGQLRGKVVIVYYWASWNNACISDFAKIKALQASFGSKGLELVCINLDNNPGDAVNFLNRTPVQGIHLYEAGALESPLAVQYGIMVLPNLFLVGKDGKVVSRSIQIGGLEDEIKKLLEVK
jgi:thiol-disulfide isomerase/thioredoxin